MPVAGFTEDFFWSTWCVCGQDRFLTLFTCSLVKDSSIFLAYSLVATHFGMFCWNREMMLDIKCELFRKYFKWFFWDRANNYSRKKSINVFLCNFIANNFFTIFTYIKRGNSKSCKRFRLIDMPSPVLSSSNISRYWEIFLCYRFIVSVGTPIMREEFTPFRGRSHMINNFWAKCLIFLLAVKPVEYSIFLMPAKSHAPKKVFWTMTKFGVERIPTFWRINRKTRHASLITGEIFIIPLTKSWNDDILTICTRITHLIIFTVNHFVRFKTIETILGVKEIFTNTIFTIDIAVFLIKNTR